MPLLNVNFERLSQDRFLAKGRTIHTSLGGHPDFPQPWPDCVPTLDRLNETINIHQEAHLAALTGDRNKIALRKTTRKELTIVLTNISHYLELVASGDPQKLIGTGFDLRKESTYSSSGAGTLPAPNFSVKQGELPGTMVGRANRVPYAGSYMMHMAKGDPTVEANWTYYDVFVRCSHILIENLEPGTLYSFRLRAIGTNGPGAWSTPCSLMAT